MSKNKSLYERLSVALERAQSDADDAASSARGVESELEKMYDIIESMTEFGSPVIREAVSMAMPMLIAKYGHASQEVRDAESFVSATK